MSHVDPVVVGRVQGAYGVRGWIRLTSYTDPGENLLQYHPWLLQATDKSWSELSVRQVKAHKQGFVAELTGVADRNAAEELKGRLIGVPAAVLPEPAEDEYYWRDLIGMEVVDLHNGHRGEVARLLETGANDVLVIRTPEGERLIPFAGQYVIAVDAAARRMQVDWDWDLQ